jgi:hypothetical protein
MVLRDHTQLSSTRNECEWPASGPNRFTQEGKSKNAPVQGRQLKQQVSGDMFRQLKQQTSGDNVQATQTTDKRR